MRNWRFGYTSETKEISFLLGFFLFVARGRPAINPIPPNPPSLNAIHNPHWPAALASLFALEGQATRNPELGHASHQAKPDKD